MIFIKMLCIGQNNTLSGRVIDNQSGEPIEYALVSTHKQDSSVIESTYTDSLGIFQIRGKFSKDYYLEVQFLGYKSLQLSLDKSGDNNILGEIRLVPSSNLLNEVTVTGQQLSAFQKIDRQSYKASQFTNATGGTAFDLIKNLPAIATDAEGNISLRGSQGFLLMVNGKLMNVDPKTILSQISASSIDDIEIITTPSAKYDPDGKGGIIQIRSKKINTDGYSISGGVNAGLPSIQNYDNKAGQQRYGADFTYNLRKGKLDLLLGADYLRDDRSGQRDGYVNTLTGNVLTELPSFGERSFDQTNYSFRASANLQMTKNQSINASFYGGAKDQARTADILYSGQQRLSLLTPVTPTQAYESFLQSGKPNRNGQIINTQTIYNENLRVRNGQFLLAGLDYQATLANKTIVKLSTLYESAQLGGPTDNYNYDGVQKNKIYQYQFNDNNNPLTGFRTQIDLEKTIQKVKIETGYQYRYTSHPGDFLYKDLNLNTNKLETVPLFTNKMGLKRNIHSIYGQFTTKIASVNVTGGLRVESTYRDVTLDVPKANYEFDTINIFPNLAMSYKPTEKLSFRAGYSKRVQRNTTSMLTPFPEREHSETLEQGDAQLRPEFIDNVELGAQYLLPNGNLFVTLYHRDINNLVNRVNSVYNDTILNRIYTNAGNARIQGIELGGNINVGSKVKWYVGVNVFNYNIKGNLLGDNINVSNGQYSFNTSLDITLLSKIGLQVGTNYLSGIVTAQGIDSRFYLPFLSLTKKINDRLTLVANWINIDLGLLRTNEQEISTWRNDFYTTTNYIHEVDIIKFAATYKINQVSKSNKFKSSEFGAQEF
jgi:outer membrane receptor protein involved in Fe transport